MPTTDIVERLREYRKTIKRLTGRDLPGTCTMLDEAADLLEKLPVDAEGNRVLERELVWHIEEMVWWTDGSRKNRVVGSEACSLPEGKPFWKHRAAAEAALQEQQAREGE